MRVAMYYHNQDVRVEEIPCPRIGSGEVLLRVFAAGICGGDVMEWYRRKKAPLVLGHEIAGEIVEVGEGVKSFRVGDRVSASHHVPCYRCYYCRNGHHTACETLRQTNFDPGGFAEFVRLPAINVERGVYPLPEGMSFEEATFIEPLACALRAQKKVKLWPGSSLLILGSGMAGILHLKLARIMGAGRIMVVDINEYRLEAASRLGADLVLHAEEDVERKVRQFNENRLADFVFVCTGAYDALVQAFKLVERGGTVLLYAPTEPGVAVPISVNEFFFRNEVTITTSYAAAPEEHWTARDLIYLQRVTVKELITHRLALEEVGYGFRLVSEARDCLKVIIEPQS